MGNNSRLTVKRREGAVSENSETSRLAKVKFEIYGEEMIEKVVKASGNSGRVYLPPDWVGRYVKVIRVD